MIVNKRKIFNDPVYGFISIPDELIFDIIEHPYFQRLRRIKQLGLTHLVYPGALHTRFHHALGTMHLMMQAIEILRLKDVEITDEEALGVIIAILLHDIGHGPFSHALEHSIVNTTNHELLSLLFFQKLNITFNHRLDLAIAIFSNKYHKKFLHQLVSSQLDIDRLDYLKRDSFYTGVSEGVIGTDRIIKMMQVVNDELVIEAKGIYSIEKFIVARRLMYWQVYFHKTVLAAESILVKVLERAKELTRKGEELFATPSLKFFLKNQYTFNDFLENDELFQNFSNLDDYDIYTSMKVWTTHPDIVLSYLSKNIINRQLFRIEIQNKVFDKTILNDLKEKIIKKYNVTAEDANYLVFTGNIENNAYNPTTDHINILYRNGEVKDITEATEQFNISILSETITKYFICYPKEIVF